MTQEEWEKVDQSFEELCNVYLPIEYAHEFRQFTRTISRFIDDNKPFEVEVDMKYVSKFDILITIGNSVIYRKITKNHSVTIYSYDRDSVTAIHDGVYFSMGLDQFKASFKPMENNNER